MLRRILKGPALYAQELRYICRAQKISSQSGSCYSPGNFQTKLCYLSNKKGKNNNLQARYLSIGRRMCVKATGAEYSCLESASRAGAGLVEETESAIDIEFIGISDVELWKSGLDSREKCWVESTGFSGQEGETVTIPNTTGSLDRVVCVVEDSGDIWSFASLPGKLAPSVYRIGKVSAPQTTGVRVEDAIALGWAMGTYSFDRYKSKDRSIGKKSPSLVWPQGCDRLNVLAVAEGIFFARDMITTPAEDMGAFSEIFTIQCMFTHYDTLLTSISDFFSPTAH